MDSVTYRKVRSTHWNSVAIRTDHWQGLGRRYFRRLTEIFRNSIPEKMKVLELGCGQGDLLAALKPARGVGIDFSKEMICRAQERHPELEFIIADAHEIPVDLDEKFDFIILSDLVNDLWDVQTVLEQCKRLCKPQTRILINLYSRLWEGPLKLAEKLGAAKPNLEQNWLEVKDIIHLLNLSGYEHLRTSSEIIDPFNLPVLGPFFNRFLVKFGLFRWMALTNFIVAKPVFPLDQSQLPVVSVIVAARNEEGNIKSIFERIPQMGKYTELVFVEGHSKDQTFEEIQRQAKQFPNQVVKFFKQTGKGKGDAVRLGFAEASGDILMILDADLTMPPEYLPRFYSALVENKGEFINGVRLVYPMEQEAMRFFNIIGNKFFSLAFSWLLGQSIKDTLRGTKVLWTKDYEQIANNRSYFGNFDPFGDFDLLFGATRLNLKIVDLPIRYKERTYGTTNISRWKHGMLLLRMVAFAATRIKFV